MMMFLEDLWKWPRRQCGEGECSFVMVSCRNDRGSGDSAVLGRLSDSLSQHLQLDEMQSHLEQHARPAYKKQLRTLC